MKTDREPCLCPLAPSGTPRDSCPPLAFRSRLSHVRTRKHAQSIDLWSNTDLHTTWGADRALMATALNRITCAPCVQVHARGWCELLVCVRQTDDSRGRVSVVSVSVCSLSVRLDQLRVGGAGMWMHLAYARACLASPSLCACVQDVHVAQGRRRIRHLVCGDPLRETKPGVVPVWKRDSH